MLKFEVRNKKSGETHKVVSSSLLMHYGGEDSFGNFLKQTRENKGLTIEEVAKLLGYHDIAKTMSTLTSIEDGYTNLANYFGKLLDIYEISNEEIKKAVIKHNIAEDIHDKAREKACNTRLSELKWESYHIKPMSSATNERLTQAMQERLKEGYVILSVGRSIDDWFEESGLSALSDEEQEKRGFSVSLLQKMWKEQSIQQLTLLRNIVRKKYYHSITWGVFEEQTNIKSSYNTKYRIPAMLSAPEETTLSPEQEKQTMLVACLLLYNIPYPNSNLTFTDLKKSIMELSNEFGQGSVLVSNPESDFIEIYRKSYNRVYSTHTVKEGSNPFATYCAHLEQDTIGFGKFTHTYYGARSKTGKVQAIIRSSEIYSGSWFAL